MICTPAYKKMSKKIKIFCENSHIIAKYVVFTKNSLDDFR